MNPARDATLGSTTDERDPPAPWFREGDLVVFRSVIRGHGGMPDRIVTAAQCQVLRVVRVIPDEDALDREGEPGFGHTVICQPVIGATRTMTLMQGQLCAWAERRDEVLAAYRDTLTALEALSWH